VTVEYKNPATMPPPIGPYSHLAKTSTDIVFFAGMAAVDANGKPLGVGDLAEQARLIWAEMGEALRSEGLGYTSIVYMTTYVKRREDIPAYYEVRGELFKRFYPEGMYPPNALFIISDFVKTEMLLEVQFIAAR
jgi:enamine deaminase RidA (YjgF/YER057c/UK114 family)